MLQRGAGPVRGAGKNSPRTGKGAYAPLTDVMTQPGGVAFTPVDDISRLPITIGAE